MLPRYPVPWELALHLAGALVLNKRRSFGEDARRSVAKLKPAIKVLGRENIPTTGPCLVTANHYSRPGFSAWWLALGISAALPYEILWTVTAAWTYQDRLRRRLVTPLSRRLFRRIARIYGFINMPPMPPDPGEAMQRAIAVRAIIDYVQKADHAVVGFAPEGRDYPGGILGSPPAGVGRFMLHLSDRGMVILPVGFFEVDQQALIKFGRAYQLDIPANLPSHERDRMASRIVMRRIAELLPVSLQGEYREG